MNLVGSVRPLKISNCLLEYVLFAKGRDLGPIVRAMRDWGRRYAR